MSENAIFLIFFVTKMVQWKKIRGKGKEFHWLQPYIYILEALYFFHQFIHFIQLLDKRQIFNQFIADHSALPLHSSHAHRTVFLILKNGNRSGLDTCVYASGVFGCVRVCVWLFKPKIHLLRTNLTLFVIKILDSKLISPLDFIQFCFPIGVLMCTRVHAYLFVRVSYCESVIIFIVLATLAHSEK